MIGKKAIIRGAVVVVLLSVAGGGAYYVHSNSAEQMNTEQVTMGHIQEIVEVSGKIDSSTYKAYYAMVSAPVKNFSMKEGDIVRAGEQLLVFDTSDLENNTAKAVQNVEVSESTYQELLKKGNENAQKFTSSATNVETYKMLISMQRSNIYALQEIIGQRSVKVQGEVRDINKRINDRQAELTNKSNELAALKNTVSSNEISNEDISKKAERIQREITSITNDIKNLNNDSVSLSMEAATPEEQRQLSEANALLNDMQIFWNQDEARKSASEAGLVDGHNKKQAAAAKKVADLTAELAETNLEKASTGVTADFNGVITELNIEQDALALQGTRLFVLKSNEDLMVKVLISKYDIAKIELGQSAAIDVAGNIYEGKVSKIHQIAIEDNSDKPKISVEIHIDNPDTRTYLGMEADVKITTGAVEDIPTVNKEAVYKDDIGEYCYILDDGVIEKRSIVTGLSSENLMEIKEGLTENETVIIDSVTDSKIGKKAQAAE